MTGDEVIAELKRTVPGLYLNSSKPVYLFNTYRFPLFEPNATSLSFKAAVDWTLSPAEKLHLIVPSRMSRHVKLPSSEPI